MQSQLSLSIIHPVKVEPDTPEDFLSEGDNERRRFPMNDHFTCSQTSQASTESYSDEPVKPWFPPSTADPR
jgi:hypothetical protein